jgi:hypothetical protein
MIAPKETLLRAIIALQNDPNFQIIIDWINAGILQNSIELASIQAAEPLRMAQGRVQELIGFKRMFTDASALLDTMRARQHAEQVIAEAKKNAN